MSDQYALCWNNYKKNLSSGFYSLYSKGDFTDVTLSAEGQLIQAHRMVLAVCSPYFRNLFEKTPTTNHPIVFLKDITYKNLTNLIQFMYSGEVHVKQDDLPSFIAFAESLQIKGLTEVGVNDIDDNSNTNNCSRNGESTSVSRSTRASKRTSRKESDDDVPLKYRKRTRNARQSKNDEDPLEDGASTSQMNFIATKCEPVLDDNNIDDDNFNDSYDKDDDDDNFDDTTFLQHNNKSDSVPTSRPEDADNAESGGPAPVEFFPTKMGGYVMVHDSQIYSLERRGGGHWYWCCNLKGPRRCPARCQTTSQFDSVVIRNSDHNHENRSAEIERRRLKVTATAGPDDCAEWMRRLDAQQNLKDERKAESIKDEN